MLQKKHPTKRNSKDDFCKNTSIFYPSLFITKKKEFINNYKNINDVLKTFDSFYKDGIGQNLNLIWTFLMLFGKFLLM